MTRQGMPAGWRQTLYCFYGEAKRRQDNESAKVR
jgi:hypothetical protein